MFKIKNSLTLQVPRSGFFLIWEGGSGHVGSPHWGEQPSSAPDWQQVACFHWVWAPAMASESPHSSGFTSYHLLGMVLLKNISVTLKPTSMCRGKWLAKSHYLWCRKIPASFPASKPSRKPWNEVVFTTHMIFFHSSFVETSFTHGLKGKGG